MEKMQNHSVRNSISAGELDVNYWNERYKAKTTAWDMGEVSPPLKAYIDQLTNKDLRILIPGCGNSYEAEYLLQKGFTNISLIDIAPDLIRELKSKFQYNQNIKIIAGDFFKHEGEYDLILEQTFFCALNPALREHYVEAMVNLLPSGGKIVGVLFDREFEQIGPPFGGTATEYRKLFEKNFKLKIFESCTNSFSKRAGTELFMVLKKH